jgi:hypothetical protein
MKLIEPGTRIRFRRGDGTEQEDTVRSVFWQEAGPGPHFVPAAAVAVTLTEHSWCYAADITGWLGVPFESRMGLQDEGGDEDEYGSQDGDGFIVLSNYRYFASLGREGGFVPAGQPRNGYPDPDVAAYELAGLMAEHRENPDSWMCGEHGPSEREYGPEVDRHLDPDGGLIPLAGVLYEPGTEVQSNDGTWEVIRDYGELGVWLAVPGDRSAGERFTQHELVDRTDLMSEARGWIADCALVRGEVADLSDFQVKRIVESLYEGGWAQLTADYDRDHDTGDGS